MGKKSEEKDQMASRMKQYEHESTQLKVDSTKPIIVRIDGKAFHTYTRGMDKPFDAALMQAMDYTTINLLDLVQDTKLAYVQSDEISLLLWNPNQRNGQPYFGGKAQKIASVVASMATAHFNDHMRDAYVVGNKFKPNLAYFDARVFNVPDMSEAANYFLWRLYDWRRNFISVVASQHFSDKELHGKGKFDRDQMLKEKLGENWRDAFTKDQQYGRMFAFWGDTKDYVEGGKRPLILRDNCYEYQTMSDTIGYVIDSHEDWEKML